MTVTLVDLSERPLLRIVDLASGLVTDLDPADALPYRRATRPSAESDALPVTVEIDVAANGPRLKITRISTQDHVYLDPLELSDAAVAGAWAKLPPAYDATEASRG